MSEAHHIEQYIDLRLGAGRRLEAAKRIKGRDAHVLDHEIGLLRLERIEDLLQVRSRSEELQIDGRTGALNSEERVAGRVDPDAAVQTVSVQLESGTVVSHASTHLPFDSICPL